MYFMYLHIIKTGQKCYTEHISCEDKFKWKQQRMLYFDEAISEPHSPEISILNSSLQA